MARAITYTFSKCVLSAYYRAGTVLNISSALIQEKGITSIIPFWQMRKIGHTANE